MSRCGPDAFHTFLKTASRLYPTSLYADTILALCQDVSMIWYLWVGKGSLLIPGASVSAKRWMHFHPCSLGLRRLMSQARGNFTFRTFFFLRLLGRSLCRRPSSTRLRKVQVRALLRLYSAQPRGPQTAEREVGGVVAFCSNWKLRYTSKPNKRA